MAKREEQNKKKILSEFEMMRGMELTAKELYLKIAASDDADKEIKNIFTKMAQDEQSHSEIVQKIINIASNAL